MAEQAGFMRFTILMALGVSFGLSGPLLAGDPPPFPEFTFKMGKPPKPGKGKLITVQIDPEEQRAAKPAATEDTTPNVPSVNAAYGWFWTKVSPGLNEDGAARLRMAPRPECAGPSANARHRPRP